MTSGNNVIEFVYNRGSWMYENALTRLIRVKANGLDVASFSFSRPNLTVKTMTGGFEDESLFFEYGPDDSEFIVKGWNGVKDASGYLFENEYRDDGRVEVRWDEDGSSMFYEYAARVTSEVDHTGMYAIHEYNADGRLGRLTRVDGQATFAYDERGNPTVVTDANMGVTTMEYGGAGNLIRHEDAEHRVVSMEYDGRNNLIKRIDGAGREWTFGYDANDYMSASTDPLATRPPTSTTPTATC